MWQTIKILLMVFLPLAWGLGSDYIFARLQRRRALAKGVEDTSA